VAREQVLVVEDNEKSMKLFRDALCASGYRTLAAGTGGLAIELAVEHGPDLVLMDIRLPDLDGVEVLTRLRADERTASIPVLALTAQAMHGDRERFLDAGFDDYVAKPVDVRRLLETVHRHCAARSRSSTAPPSAQSRVTDAASVPDIGEDQEHPVRAGKEVVE
jgi:two-component system cell cycle response regulator DivK